MSWLYYLLEANLYLLVCFAFYLLVLRRETFYNLNRFYLIGTSLLAFIIPVLQLGLLKPSLNNEVLIAVPDTAPVITAQFTSTLAPDTWEITDVILPIYLLMALFFFIKTCAGIFGIAKIYWKAKKHRFGKAIVVELEDEKNAFSFFHLLFINPQMAKKDLIFKHELIHIQQKHSWDVIFVEFLQIINWFNPIIYFLKKEIKVLHEYIADELTTPTLATRHEYAMVLIENSLQFKSNSLVNQFFNQSILKRRIIMLNKEKTRSWARLKLALMLPLVGAMLWSSTSAFTKDYGYVDLLPEKAGLQTKPSMAISDAILDQTTGTVEITSKPAAFTSAVDAVNDTLKFPPPVVAKQEKIKFPPPTIKKYKATPQHPSTKQKPASKKKEVIKFPPPIVKPDIVQKDVEEIVVVGRPSNKKDATNSSVGDIKEVVVTGFPIPKEINVEQKSQEQSIENQKKPAKKTDDKKGLIQPYIGLIIIGNKQLEAKGRVIKSVSGASQIGYYAKNNPVAIAHAIEKYGPKAKDGVLVLNEGKVEFVK